MMIFRLLSVKVNDSVLTQSLSLFPIAICCPPLIPLSHPGWHSAMVDEMQDLYDNVTWDLVSLPAGKKAIGCRRVFAVKFNPDESVARLKAHLVAKGYGQTYGVDYSDNFSPIAKLTFVRLFISLVASYD